MKIYLRIKRILDLAITILALVITWPLFLLIMALIKISSPGPVFFKQRRIGKDKKAFLIYNVVTTKANLIKRGQGAELRHRCNEIAA